MLGIDTKNGIPVYKGDTDATFDAWGRKFMDYLDACGKHWSRQEKLGRLKLYLDGSPRQMYEELTSAEKSDVSTALAALKIKIDSPERRELARQSLAMCKQGEYESVQAFAERLIPLVNAACVGMEEEARKDRLCECFVERLKDNLKLLVRVLGTTKNFEEAKTKAIALDFILSDKNKSHADSSITQALQSIKVLNTQSENNMHPQPYPAGRYSNWAHEQGNNQENFCEQNLVGARDRGQSGQNDRNWNEKRLFCHYCERVGHDLYNCRNRQSEAIQNNIPYKATRFQDEPIQNKNEYPWRQSEQPQVNSLSENGEHLNLLVNLLCEKLSSAQISSRIASANHQN